MQEEPGAELARKLAESPASLSRRPIVELARAVVEGRSRARCLVVPEIKNANERATFLAELEHRASEADQFVTGLAFDYDAASNGPLARYVTLTGVLLLNAWHPFVATFHEEFAGRSSRQPLELLAMAEVLAEAQLHVIGVKPELIEEFLSLRDQLLRNLANESGLQSPFAVAMALKEARNNPAALEEKLCDAFTSLGFDVRQVGGKGKPDGVAVAFLPPDVNGQPGQYAVSLDAKSKAKDRGKVSAGSVKIATIARHRDDSKCEHALVLGRDFPAAEDSALAKEIEADRTNTAASGKPRTITLITIDDLATLVHLRPIKRVGLRKLRTLFECQTSTDSHNWVENIRASKVSKPPYRRIVETIAEQQKRFKQAYVKYAALRVALSLAAPPINYETDGELRELCMAMAQLSDGTMYAGPDMVELDQSPGNVIAAIDAATTDHVAEEA